MNPILFEKKDHIGWITLNSPKQRNALSLELMNELQKKLNNMKKDKEVKVKVKLYSQFNILEFSLLTLVTIGQYYPYNH